MMRTCSTFSVLQVNIVYTISEFWSSLLTATVPITGLGCLIKTRHFHVFQKQSLGL